MPSHQIVILSDTEDSSSSMAVIGDRKQIVEDLAGCNTRSDMLDGDILYGPGFRIELSPGQDPVTQMLLTIDDEDIAWTVIMRLSKKFQWKLLDPMTGRELRPH